MSEQYSVNFHSVAGESASDLLINQNSIVFHGRPLDERGREVIACWDDKNKNLVEYNAEEMVLSISGVAVQTDQIIDILKTMPIQDQGIIFEATTLGFAELFLLMHAFFSLGFKKYKIIYVEPKEYTRPLLETHYDLSVRIKGYLPIPHSVIDLSSTDTEAGVFFLGFESARLERALEEYQMISAKDLKVIFGAPAYQPGWELEAIVPHLKSLKEHSLHGNIEYCAANDPEAAFECLELTRKSLGSHGMMFIAPIGPKPCGIATAIFTSIYAGQVGIIFDHPERKPKRSQGASVWHDYSIDIIKLLP